MLQKAGRDLGFKRPQECYAGEKWDFEEWIKEQWMRRVMGVIDTVVLETRDVEK
jgi:hypothetical protein